MSIVIYKDGVMYSDSQGEIKLMNYYDPIIFEASKLFVSEDGTLLMGMVGDVFNKDALTTLMNCLRDAAKEFVLNGTFPESIEDDEMYLTDDINFIAATTDVVFTRTGTKYSELPRGMPFAIGSTVNQATYLLAAGWSPIKIIDWLIDNNGTISGPIVLRPVSDLKPLMGETHVSPEEQ